MPKPDWMKKKEEDKKAGSNTKSQSSVSSKKPSNAYTDTGTGSKKPSVSSNIQKYQERGKAQTQRTNTTKQQSYTPTRTTSGSTNNAVRQAQQRGQTQTQRTNTAKQQSYQNTRTTTPATSFTTSSRMTLQERQAQTEAMRTRSQRYTDSGSEQRRTALKQTAKEKDTAMAHGLNRRIIENDRRRKAEWSAIKEQNAKEWESVKGKSKEEQQQWFSEKAKQAQLKRTGKESNGTDNLPTDTAKSFFYGLKEGGTTIAKAVAKTYGDNSQWYQEEAIKALEGTGVDLDKKKKGLEQTNETTTKNDAFFRNLIRGDQEQLQKLLVKQSEKYDSGAAQFAAKAMVGGAYSLGGRSIDTLTGNPFASMGVMGLRVYEGQRGAVIEQAQPLIKQMEDAGFSRERINDFIARVDEMDERNALAMTMDELKSEAMFGAVGGIGSKYIPKGKGVFDALTRNIGGKTVIGQILKAYGEEGIEEVANNYMQASDANRIYLNEFQELQEEIIKKSYQDSLGYLKAASADVNSDRFFKQSVESYKQAGASDEEAKKLARLAIDYFNADLEGNKEASEKAMDEILNYLARGENDLRQSVTMEENLDAIGATIAMVTMSGGGTRPIVSSMVGNQYKANFGVEGVRNLAETVKALDPKNAAKATAMLDQMQKGQELTGSQVSELMQDADNAINESYKREIAADKTKDQRVKQEGLTVLPGTKANGFLRLEEKTAEVYQEVFDSTVTKLQEMNDSTEVETSLGKAEIASIAHTVASFRTGMLDAEQVNNLSLSHPEARTIFEQETGIDLNKYNVKDKNGNIDEAASNIAMQEGLFAQSVENFVEMGRLEQSHWEDKARKAFHDSVKEGMGKSGGLAVHEALKEVDARDAVEYKITAMAAQRVYYDARNTNDSWDDAKKKYRASYPSVSIDALQKVFEAGKEDKAAAETPYLGRTVAIGKAMRFSTKSDSTALRMGEFTNESDRVLGEEDEAYRSLAKNTGLNIRLVKAEELEELKVDEKGNIVLDEKGNAIKISVNGKYNRETGEILLSDRNSFGDNINIALSHEMTHHIATFAPEAYMALSNYVMDKWFKNDPNGMQQQIKRMQELYKTVGQNLTEEEALEEIIADATRDFWNNPEFVNEFTSNNSVESVKSIWDAIKNIVNRIRAILSSGNVSANYEHYLWNILGDYTEAERLWLNAYREAQKNAAAVGIAQWQEEANKGGEVETKYSIIEDYTDYSGKKYDKVVLLDTDSFKNKKHQDRKDTTEKNVFAMAGEGEYTDDGVYIELAEASERVMKDGASNEHIVLNKLARIKGISYQFAASHALELVKVSRPVEPAEKAHNNNNEHDWMDRNGWDFREAYILTTTGQVKKVLLNIALSEDGRHILYDLTKMKTIGNGNVPLYKSDSAKNSNGEDIIASNKVRNKQYSDAIKRGDSVTVEGMVYEAADKAMPKSIIREGQAVNLGEQEEGTLVPMFHGSGANDFYSFNMQEGMLGKGAYFTSAFSEAVDHAKEKLGITETNDGKWLWNGEEYESDELEDALYEQGYVREFYLNVTDENDVTHSKHGNGNIIAVIRKKNQAKSAEPITKDYNGNVIPISSRFDMSVNDFRYSIPEVTPEQDADYMKAVESGDMETAQRMVDEVAEKKGWRPVHRYHGTMNANFTQFDKRFAKVGGNSGAGFYFSTEEDDSVSHYEDVEGADNYFKWSKRAEEIWDALNEGTWEGEELDTYEEVEAYAKKELSPDPGTFDVYLAYDNPYIRDYKNSTNIYDKIMDSFDESLVDENDYEDEDDYYNDYYDAKYNHISEEIYGAVYNANSSLEDNYEVLYGPMISDIADMLTQHAIEYESLTWTDIIDTLYELGETEVTNDDWSESADATPEIARAIIEEFGFDAIEDKEVASKFGQLSREMMTGTEHIIVFKPEQIKDSSPVTYDDDGNVIPLSQRFDAENKDIRYSLGTESDIMHTLEDSFNEYKEDKQNLRIATEALADLQRVRYSVDSDEVSGRWDGGVQVRTLAKGITTTLLNEGRVDFRGQTVKNPEDLAKLCQVLRDPRYETFRLVLTKGNKIVSFRSLSSRLPGLSAAFELDDVRESIDLVRDRMNRLGADGYYLVHNHPSGNVNASFEDLSVTRAYLALLGVDTYKGHIILDHDEFGFIDADIPQEINGANYPTPRVEAISGQQTIDFIHEPEIDHVVLGSKIKNSKDVAKVAQTINSTDEISVLLYTSTKAEVRGVQEISNKALKNNKEIAGYIRNQAVEEFGSSGVFLYTTDLDTYNASKELIESGHLVDSVIGYGANKELFESGRENVAEPGEIGKLGLTDEEDAKRKFVFESATEAKSYDSLRYSITPKMDQDYVAAIRSGNTEEAQRLVEEAAKAAGYKEYVYHGTGSYFSEFDASNAGRNHNGYSKYGKGFYFSSSEDTANYWGQNRRMIKAYIRLENPFDASGFLSEGPLFEEWKKVRKKAGLSLRDRSPASDVIETLNEFKGRDFTTNFLMKLGYDGVIVHHEESDSRYTSAPWEGTTEYVVFEPEQIKSADTITYTDNEMPIMLSERFNPESRDIRYSLPTTDADGKVLKDGQMEYFKNSQARDEQGRLVPVFHVTRTAGFTIFDPSRSFDGRSISFSNDIDFALNYSSEDGDLEDWRTAYENRYGMEEVESDLDNEVIGHYEVYLDIQNPLIVTEDLLNEMDIYELPAYAQDNGYDGLIIRDFEGMGADIYQVFSSNQIKDTRNENPTENPDIRYSIVPEDEALSRIAYEHATDDSFEALLRYEELIARADVDPETYNIKPFKEDDIAKLFAALNHTEAVVYSDPIAEEDRVRMAKSKIDFFGSLNAKWNARWTTDGQVLDVKSVRKDIKNLVMGVMANSDTDAKYRNELVRKMLFDVRTAYQLMKQDRQDVASSLLYHSALRMIEGAEFYVDDGYYDRYLEIRDYFRNTKISLGEEYWSDVDYGAFRKNNYGRMNLVKGKTNVDQIYLELCEWFPEYFKEDETLSVPDQLEQMAHVLDIIQPYKEAYSSEEAAELAFDIADSLYEIMEGGKEVVSLADTYKNRYDAKTKAMKQRHAEAMQKVRENRDKGIQAERAKWQAKEEKRKDKDARNKAFGKIQKDYDWLVQRVLDPTKEKNVPEEFRAALADMLMTLDLQTISSKAREFKKNHVANKTFKMRELKDRLNDLATRKGEEGTGIFELDANVGYLMDSLANKLDGQPVDALDTSTMRDIGIVLASIRHNMQRVNQIRVEEKRAETADIAAGIIGDFKDYVTKHGRAKTYGGIREFMRTILTSQTTPAYFFERLGAFNGMYNELRFGGFDTYIRNEKQIIERMTEITSQYYKTGKIRKRRPTPGSELESWRDDRSAQTIQLTNGTVRMTAAQMMSLYCLSKRNQAEDHMAVGGIIVTPIQAGSRIQQALERAKGKVETSESVKLTHADIELIVSKLTPEQIDVANKLQELMSVDMAKLGNEAHREMYGYEVFNDDNYFPIKVAGTEIATDLNNMGDVIEKVKSFGPAKPLVPHANNKIEIDDIFTVTANHCNGMNVYASFLVPISDFMKVYNYKLTNEDGSTMTVKEALKAAHGTKAEQYIVKLLKDINGIKPNNKDGLKGIITKALGTAKKTAVFGNIRVAAQQVTAIARAQAEMNPKYLTPFLKVQPEKGVMQEMWDYCPIAYWKSLGYYDAYMGRDLEDVMMNNWSMADAALSDVYGQLDNWTWSVIWRGVKAEQADLHPEMDVNSDEFKTMCGRRASEIFDKTQVVDSTFHRSDAMRSDDIAVKSLTAFMAEPTLTLNVFRAGLVKAIDAWTEGNKLKAGKIFTKTVNVIVTQAALVSLAQALADAWRGKDPDLPWEDDDDEEDSGYFNLLLQNLVANFFENLHLENNIYLVKDAMPLFNYIMTQAGNYHEWNPTFRFIMGWDQDFLYSNNNLVYAGGENIAKGVAQIYKKLTKGDDYDKSWYDIIQKTGGGIGTFIGVPIGTLMRDFKPIIEKITLTPFAADGTEEDTDSFVKTVVEKLGGSKKSKKEDGAEASESSIKKEDLPDNLTDEQKEEIIKAADKRKEKENAEPMTEDELLYKVLKSTAGMEDGEEKDKKIYSAVANGLNELAAAGNYAEIDKRRRVIQEAGGDTAYFDSRVMAASTAALKKSINYDATDKEIDQQARIFDYLTSHGMSSEEISSEIIYKSDIAKDLKVAFRLGDKDLMLEALRPLAEAGIEYDDVVRLWENRNRMDLKKYEGRFKSKLKSTGTFVWPTQGTITSGFGYRDAPTRGASSYHQAIDIGAPEGTPVVAVDGGVVISAGWNGGYGYSVGIRHDDGTVTYYNHLSNFSVKEGDSVSQGQDIAQVGSTGVSTEPHLDFKVLNASGKAVDPMKYLQNVG